MTHLDLALRGCGLAPSPPQRPWHQGQDLSAPPGPPPQPELLPNASSIAWPCPAADGQAETKAQREEPFPALGSSKAQQELQPSARSPAACQAGTAGARLCHDAPWQISLPQDPSQRSAGAASLCPNASRHIPPRPAVLLPAEPCPAAGSRGASSTAAVLRAAARGTGGSCPASRREQLQAHRIFRLARGILW